MLSSFNEPKKLHPVAVKAIYNTVGTDLIGPVQISAKGTRYTITCVDYLTKNVEARAVPNKASDTVADFFWEEIICRHGNVATVISDRGGHGARSFVMVKNHEQVRKSGNKHGKLANKVHGPYILHHFTDSSQQVAVLQDAADKLYKQRAAGLCIYRGTR
ncbi:hypothetical protein WJX77_010987 [Trebouxia sp. C0004]